MINTWKELDEKFSMYREDMTEEQERDFVQHCFDLYEKEGFAKIFWSQSNDFSEYIGKPFKVIRRLNEDDSDLECLPMWHIRFEDGKEIDTFPDEIIPREMKENGCKLDNIA